MMLNTAALIFIVTSNVVLGKECKVEPIFSLDMAKNSADDQYTGCTEKMENLVKNKYLEQEIRADKFGFKTSWKNGENKYNGSQDNLSRNNLIAIFVYTGRTLHSKFSEDVINGKTKYKEKSFSWYSLHFYLTEAIQTLKNTPNECTSTYRGTKVKFTENVLNKEIRFGLFASSSLDREEAKKFGSESCFEIVTCYGANVTKYSEHPREKEVLIPPYEKFKVTAIRKDQKDDWCKTVFMLKSTGIESYLNCEVVPKNKKIKKVKPGRQEGYGFLLF